MYSLSYKKIKQPRLEKMHVERYDLKNPFAIASYLKLQAGDNAISKVFLLLN